MNNFNYTNLKPFKWFCLKNFPFIEANFDAITYYELLCKIVEYLNKVIESENALGLQVENITKAVTELQTYVDNYFDNLNVQEEIDNKLDEMAESGELGEIINQKIFNELNGKVNTNTQNIEEIEETIITEPYYNVLKNGGHDDGTTPNDTIITNAINAGYKKFYFPQNEAQNAVYYFTNTPNLNNCEIITDKDVKISIPTMYSNTNLNSGKYNTNIKFVYRSQNQEALTPSNNSDLFNMLHINTDYRLKNMITYTYSDSNLKMFHYKYYSDFLFEEVTKNDYYEENNLFINRKSNTSNNYFNGLCVPITDKRNCIETCSNGNNTRVKYVLLNNENNQGIYCDYDGGGILIYYNASQGTRTKRINMFNHNLGLSNDWSLPCQYKIRYLKDKNLVQFIFNNQVAGEYDLPFIPNYFGFGLQDGNSDLKMMRFCTYYQENLPLNYNLKLLIVGDSRFAGDGHSYKIDDILKNGLLYNGINKVEITNLAVSGYSIGQIYNVLQNQDLSKYDIIIYEGGINNYNSTATSIAYALNDTATLLNNSGALVVYTTCMPCAWGGSDSLAAQRAQKYYGIVNAMYVGIGSQFFKNNIIIDNNMGNQVSASNLPVCSDGVHPNDLGLIEIVRNIISAIFNHFKV